MATKDIFQNLNIQTIKERKDILFIIIVIALTFFFGRKLWDYNESRVANLRQRINGQQQAIDLANEIKALTGETEKIKTLSWMTKDSVTIMGQINELAAKYSIELLSFNSGSPRNEKYYFILPLTMNVKADYFDLAKFLLLVEQLDTLTKVVTMQIAPTGRYDQDKEASLAIKASITMYAYILKE